MLHLRYPRYSLGGPLILEKQQEQNCSDRNIFQNKTKLKVDGLVHYYCN